MANHKLSARGFSAWITINGEPLQVYPDATTDTTCSAWIPSANGQTFSVWWKDDGKTRIATSGHVFVDGHNVASAILRPGRTKPVERAGAKTNDETVANKDDPTLRDMGTIKIEISRVMLGDEVPFKGYDAQNRGPVHERAKKLGAHCTSYGPSTRSPSSRTVAVSTKPYDPDMPGPYVTFIFRYRSEDILRADGVIGGAERKRRSPATNFNEVIEISDSEPDKDTSDRPAKKRAKTDKAPSDASENAPSEQPDAVSERPNNADDASEPPYNDAKMESGQLGLGTPSLLQSEPEEVGTSQAVDESQTQADDYSQIGFGAPAALLRDGIDVERGAADAGESQASEVGGGAVEDTVEESQLEVEGSMQLSEESQT